MMIQNAMTQDEVRFKNVMIVDDEPSMRMLLGLILQSHGYCVSASSNGEQAWQELAMDPAKWDLVLTDERMPKLTGRGLLRRMREAGMRVPVVLVSGFVDDDASGIARAGANGLLHKPFELEDVISMVSTLEGVTPPATALEGVMLPATARP